MAKINKNIRKILWVCCNGFCPICGCKMDNKGSPHTNNHATIDHIIPLSKQGTNNIENLRLICRQCNNNRGSKPVNNLKFFKEKNGKIIVVNN